MRCSREMIFLCVCARSAHEVRDLGDFPLLYSSSYATMNIDRPPGVTPSRRKTNKTAEQSLRVQNEKVLFLQANFLRAQQVYRMEHLLFFFFLTCSAALVAVSNTSRTPSFVLAEHSR